MDRPRPRGDVSWTEAFRGRYEPWLDEARPLLEAHEYAQAFRTYPFPSFATSPWAPLSTPLEAACLGVVTTAGVFRPRVDRPFADTAEGDPWVVAIPADVSAAELDLAHGHIPETLARTDVNIVLPLDPLRALVAEGAIGTLAPRVMSLVGYRTRADAVARETAPAIAATLAADGATLALVVPV